MTSELKVKSIIQSVSREVACVDFKLVPEERNEGFFMFTITGSTHKYYFSKPELLEIAEVFTTAGK
jgi:hypothetical protein